MIKDDKAEDFIMEFEVKILTYLAKEREDLWNKLRAVDVLISEHQKNFVLLDDGSLEARLV